MTRTVRKNNQTRSIEFVKNYTKHAYGSVLAIFGDTKVLVTASVENAKPRWIEGPTGWLTAEYSMLPAATNTRNSRERAKISGRTSEIQRLIGRSLRACLNLSLLGERTITIDADVIQADGGTRTASICGGFVALKLAIDKLLANGELEVSPIIEEIGAISVGIVQDEVLVDLDYSEDSTAQVDANVVLTKSGQIIEFGATSERKTFSSAQLAQMYDVANAAIQEIINKY